MQKRFSKDYSQVLCCLCLQPVSASSRKRKNFHGSSCDSVRHTLTRLSHCPLNALVQTSNPNAVICVVCHKKLVSIKACEEKLVALEGDVKNMLSSLTTIRSKRPLLVLPADTELQPPPPKQFLPAMPSLPFSHPPRVTLLTSHSSHQELAGAEHVSQVHTHWESEVFSVKAPRTSLPSYMTPLNVKVHLALGILLLLKEISHLAYRLLNTNQYLNMEHLQLVILFFIQTFNH